MIVINQALPVIYRIPYKDKMVSVAINFHCKDKCCSLHKPQTKQSFLNANVSLMHAIVSSDAHSG